MNQPCGTLPIDKIQWFEFETRTFVSLEVKLNYYKAWV